MTFSRRAFVSGLAGAAAVSTTTVSLAQIGANAEFGHPRGLARVIGTWSGFGGPAGLSYKDRNPSTRKFVVDVSGTYFTGLTRDDGVELVVSASRGTTAAVASYPVVSQPQRWRGCLI